ncbi:uncharacterized protein CDV56_108949 [Aspergillus thermomutatus]|uniref:Uncharacterized protein n=1 Tax=Aspergillus thermomutatus TaxID=41047 RepID=A0A397HUK2_ASPTH|nr:uncharacterized protein CDV56_108949 [Aspergillus thermomutatus]RHZ66901.1 hypothetical protein CDV56_108949 [Aspergillus thermomutatus]
MSSVFNHVPSRSGASLRTAHLINNRPWPKDYSSKVFSRPTHKTKWPRNGFLDPAGLFREYSYTSTAAPGEHERPIDANGEEDRWHDFWSRVRNQSQLSQSFLPPAPNHLCGRKESSCESDKSPSIVNEHSSEHEATLTGYSENKAKPSRNAAKVKRTQSSPLTPTQYLLDILHKSAHSAEDELGQMQPLNLIVNGHGKRQRETLRKHPRLSLQTILADWIRFVDPIMGREHGAHYDTEATPELDAVLRRTFPPKVMEYLTARHCSPSDVLLWSWILRSNTSHEATLRILMLESAEEVRLGSRRRLIPPFIPLLLLRRKNLDAKTFRLLLVYSLHIITGRRIPTFDISKRAQYTNQELEDCLDQQQTELLIDPTTCFAFVTRLLRHAREVWPQAQLTIARAFASYLTLLRNSQGISESSRHRRNQFMADKFNACLWLLSLPCKAGPFKFVSVQQQAQFELLKAMAGHDPVLPVTRQGYQGIIAVQLAHKKTSAERQSADLKAPSWPPWKEEKLGIDSQRGNEGMKSRAMRVMAQMREAGYSHTRWEEVSGILAGWDTDKSPTVQTRALMRRPQLLRGPAGSKPDHHAVWVARIRATRTVREAWACFLSYQDQGLPPRASVYVAMAEKLIFRRKAIDNDFDHVSHSLPGDGLEVFPEPSSARDLIYVHTEPPTLEELLKQMLSQGIRPSGRFLALLLRSAPTFNRGLDYLSCSDLSNEQIQALCTVRERTSDYDALDSKVLNELPDYLFSSFIALLCNFSSLDSLHLERHDIRTADLFPIIMGNIHPKPPKTSTLYSNLHASGASGTLQPPKTLSHAIQLLKVRKSGFTPSWIHLLTALSKDRIRTPYRRMSRSAQRVLAWYEMVEVVGWMKERAIEPGLQGHQVLCASFSKAVIAGLKHPSAAEEGLAIVHEAARRGNIKHSTVLRPQFEDMVRSGLCILKEHFDQLVLSDPKTAPFGERLVATCESATSPPVAIPPMLHVPSPAVLHAFVRALGLAGDHDGLLKLIRWMSQNAATLKETSDEHMNGDRMMRRTLVALRVFLEGYRGKRPWGPSDDLPSVSMSEGEKEPSLSNDVSNSDGIMSDSKLQEAYDIVAATPLWDSWPSDDEVWEYLHWEP